jgi:hypothetical protein
MNYLSYRIGLHTLDSIEWMKNILLDSNFMKQPVTLETQMIYGEIIDTFKLITNRYYQIKDEIYYTNVELLFNPEKLLDRPVLKRWKQNFWFTQYNEAIELLKVFEYMINVIINHTEDEKFAQQKSV